MSSPLLRPVTCSSLPPTLSATSDPLTIVGALSQGLPGPCSVASAQATGSTYGIPTQSCEKQHG